MQRGYRAYCLTEKRSVRPPSVHPFKWDRHRPHKDESLELFNAHKHKVVDEYSEKFFNLCDSPAFQP